MEDDLAAIKVGGIVYLSRNGAHQVISELPLTPACGHRRAQGTGTRRREEMPAAVMTSLPICISNGVTVWAVMILTPCR